jgi:hypothetical protein
VRKLLYLIPYGTAWKLAYFGLLGLCIVNPCNADQITFDFSGTITNIRDTYGIFDQSVFVGTSVNGSYTFDSELVDRSIDPYFGQFFGTGNYRVAFGTYTYEATAGPYRIEVGNFYDGPGADQPRPIQAFEFLAGFSPVGIVDPRTFLVFCSTNLQTDSLPLMPPSCQSGHIFLTGSVLVEGVWVDAFDIFASLDSLYLDTDDDGVPDTEDTCPDTVIPETVPTMRLGVNRFALTDDDTIFDTRTPDGREPQRTFTIADTAGCSCEQIIKALGLGQGHTKFGCSLDAMEEWTAMVAP